MALMLVTSFIHFFALATFARVSFPSTFRASILAISSGFLKYSLRIKLARLNLLAV